MRLWLLSIICAASTLTLGCRWPIVYDAKPGKAPKCTDGVCVEVVHFGSLQSAVGLWLEAPPSTRLVNAHFTVEDEPPCAGQVPVEWVRLDEKVLRSGPADVGGAHGLVLGFPFEAWYTRHNGYWRDTFVDVELEVAGRPRCVRSRLTRGEGGKEAVGL
jgi:hypothetical protein